MDLNNSLFRLITLKCVLSLENTLVFIEKFVFNVPKDVKLLGLGDKTIRIDIAIELNLTRGMSLCNGLLF